MLLGAHRSTAGGAWNAIESGKAIGCDVVQVFTRAPQRWQAKPIDPEETERFKAASKEHGISSVAHDIYLTNLASAREDIREKSIASIKDEIHRCHQMGIPYLVTHCGAHEDQTEADGIAKVGAALRESIDEVGASDVTILLEGTAGQGTALGWRFEHLRDMLAATDRPANTGVCLDTCHLFAAGYDLRTSEAFNATFEEFDRIVGFSQLKSMHANDAKKDLGSRVDRHEFIGQGKLGVEAFRILMNDPRFKTIPIMLETPDLERHEDDLKLLRSLID